MKTTLGIDYATIAGIKLDMARIKKAGTEFAIFRGSYGVRADPHLKTHWQAYKDMPRGVYMFPVMLRTREPEPQVAAFAAAIKAAGGLRPGIDLPPIFDVEYPKGVASSGLTRLQCLDWIERAIDSLTKTFGCLPMLYTSARVWDGEDDDSLDLDKVPVPRLVDCPLWLARYPYKYKIPAHYLPAQRDGLKMPPVPKQLGDADDVWLHQYQGDATEFPGVSRTVDLNRFFPAVRGKTGIERTKWIQRKLNARGYQLVLDGIWGDKTERALRELQSREKLPGTGVVDLRTFCMLSWQ